MPGPRHPRVVAESVGSVTHADAGAECSAETLGGIDGRRVTEDGAATWGDDGDIGAGAEEECYEEDAVAVEECYEEDAVAVGVTEGPRRGKRKRGPSRRRRCRASTRTWQSGIERFIEEILVYVQPCVFRVLSDLTDADVQVLNANWLTVNKRSHMPEVSVDIRHFLEGILYIPHGSVGEAVRAQFRREALLGIAGWVASQFCRDWQLCDVGNDRYPRERVDTVESGDIVRGVYLCHDRLFPHESVHGTTFHGLACMALYSHFFLEPTATHPAAAVCSFPKVSHVTASRGQYAPWTHVGGGYCMRFLTLIDVNNLTASDDSRVPSQGSRKQKTYRARELLSRHAHVHGLVLDVTTSDYVQTCWGEFFMDASVL